MLHTGDFPFYVHEQQTIIIPKAREQNLSRVLKTRPASESVAFAEE